MKILERKKEWESGSDRMSENFTYDRDWQQIHDALDKAERKQNWHMMKIQRKDTPKEELTDFLYGLPQNCFDKIKDFFATMPKIQYKKVHVCSDCENENDITIEGLSNFFG